MNGAGDVVVAEFAKNSRETIRVVVGSYRGHKLVHIRAWVAKEGGDLIPTKSGIAIRLAILPDLVAALQKVIDAPALMQAAAEEVGGAE